MMELSTTHLLDLSHTLAGEYLKQFVYPWQALEGISDLILTLGAALPEEDREIFYRFYDLSQTTAQIADELHMNASTVRSRLLRGREALRKTLTKGGLFCEDDVG